MVDLGLIQAYAATLTLAVIPIVLGSFGSLKTSKRSLRLIAEAKGESISLSPDEDEEEVERISFSDAYMFPVMGSCLLGGLYLTFKYIDKSWLNWGIGWYFTLTAFPAIFLTGSTIISHLTPKFISDRLPLYDITIKDRSTEIFSTPLPFLSLVAIPLSAAVPYFYVVLGHPWWANNIMGFSFAQNAIQLMRLDGMLTGAMLLGGLFLYDIFWVFGTDVMVSVATGLDAPIKLLFPKDPSLTRSAGFTMLGLGDIIIPGVLIALALRLDFSLHSRRHPSKPLTPSDSFPKPYFLAIIVAYVVGLVTTIVVMHTTRSAQPALLYLSPACVGAIAFTSYLKSQFSLVFFSSGWSDGEDDELEVAWRAKELAASASFEDESATLDAASVNGKGPTLEEAKVKSRVAAVVEKKEEEEQGMRLRTSGHDRDHDQEKRKA
ncbi:signal peptide peptidase-domain-containing protein [Mrakia frigida]|uniref:aspartic endopeptidase n=1 Tax=Mrakia frigida TaxID=29902 RepID=UPI003FCC005E